MKATSIYATPVSKSHLLKISSFTLREHSSMTLLPLFLLIVHTSAIS